MILGSQYSFAQFPTFSGVPASWRCDDKEGRIQHQIKEHTYVLFTDTVTGEKVALLTIRGNKEKENKLPSKIKYDKYTYTVRGIESLNKDLVEVTIPSSVQFICPGAFWKCEKLQLVFWEKGIKGCQIKTIGDEAFALCTSMRTYHMPETVDSIGSRAFEGCTSLVSIEGFPRYVKAIKEYAFKGCSSLKWIFLSRDLYPDGIVPSTVVESSLKEISEGLFSGCSSLENVHIESYRDDIRIGGYAFHNCCNLKNITVGSGIKDVGAMAFGGCKSLLSVKSKINDDIAVDVKGTIGERAFMGCSSISRLRLHDVDSIKEYAFTDCSSLPEVSLYGVQYVGSGAFERCSNLKKVIVDNLKHMGYFVFNGCPNLERIIGLTTNTEFDCNPLYLTDSKVMDFYNLCEIGYSYPYYAKSNVKKQITEWQKKKEYEKTSQWRLRVTEENRERKVKQLMDSARVSYIEKMAPKELQCEIESYDADGEVYKIKVKNINTHTYQSKEYRMGDFVYIFAKVPNNEAKAFKDAWSEVTMKPTYCLSRNYLGISSCIFKLNGKTYNSPTLYDDETADVALDLLPLEIDLGEQKAQVASTDIKIDDNLDKQIPTVNTKNDKTFAVIIGNENYLQVGKVQYAKNDARTFAAYCQKTLGLPEKNIRTYSDATYGMMLAALKDVKEIADAYNGDIDVIFYYAGHGIPDGKGNAYLLPVDADGTQPEVCLPTGRLYSELNKLNVRKLVVFMDACFSGAQRGDGMLVAARGVAIKAVSEAPEGNSVVFSAANGEETAFPYKEKGHGMFTYFLLKKLQETKGDVTLGELAEYVKTQVGAQSIVVNRKKQTPTVVPSATANDWKSMKLRPQD